MKLNKRSIRADFRLTQIFGGPSNDILFANVYKKSYKKGRFDVANPNESLQFATIVFDRSTGIRPHRHNKQNRRTNSTQEIWIVMKGKAEVKIYDHVGNVLASVKLQNGDSLHLIQGGHSLKPLTRTTIVYEVKNGPYFGPEVDRSYFD